MSNFPAHTKSKLLSKELTDKNDNQVHCKVPEGNNDGRDDIITLSKPTFWKYSMLCSWICSEKVTSSQQANLWFYPLEDSSKCTNVLERKKKKL